MRSRRNLVLLTLSLVALVALTGAPNALAAGPYPLTISTAVDSNVQCNLGNCYPTAAGANLNVTELESRMGTAATDGYTTFEIGEYGASGQTGTITIENSITNTSEPLTLDPDSGNIVIDDTTDSNDTATIDTEGTTFNAPIAGPGTGSSSLTVSGYAQVADPTSGTTLGTLDFEGGVTFGWGNSGTLTATNIDVTGNLGGPGTGGNTVTFDASGGTTLDDVGWDYAGIDSMTVDGPATLDGTFNSDGNDELQTYQGPVTLAGDTTISGHATFDSTIDSASSTAYSLTVAGSGAFDGAVGSVNQLHSLDVTGATSIDASGVTTTGSQSYGATMLAASPTLSGSAITFNSTLDGNHALTVADSGAAIFGGAIGGITPLTGLTLEAGSASPAQLWANVTTAGSQAYSQAVTLEAGLTDDPGAGHTVVFSGPVSGGDLLTAASGALELDNDSNTLTGGGVEIDSGATVDFVSGALDTGTVTLNGGTLAWDAGNTGAPNATDVTSGGGTLDIGANNVTLNAGTGGSNAGAVTKAGSGELTLAAGSGASYGNLVQVGAGSLQVTGSIITPVTVGSGATLICNGGTLGGAVTNSGGTLTGAPAAPTSVAGTDNDGVASVGFTPGTNNCFPLSYTANVVGSAVSRSGNASPLNFSGLSLGQAYSFTVTETNPLGSATSSASPALLLAVAPTITVSAPSQNASYTKGQVVNAAYSCTEASGGPGIASCSGTVANGTALDTSTVGAHTFQVTATSRDGESATTTITYTVTTPTPAPTSSPAAGNSAPPSNAFTIKTASGAANGAVKLTLSLPGAGTLKVTEVIAGVGRVTVSAHEGHGGLAKLSTALSKKLQAVLRRKHVKRAKLTITFTPSGGNKRTVSRTVSL
jgi:hypothetical protein